MPHTKDGKNSLDFQIQNFMLNLLEKKSLKKPKYYRSSPGPENSCSGNKQPYNFFSAFISFRTLPDNSGKPKSVYSKQKN